MAKFQKGQPRHPNAGRKKGTPNKATVKRRKQEAELRPKSGESVQ
jgi:hypothetical protein